MSEAVANANAAAATAFGVYNSDTATYYGSYNAARDTQAGDLGLAMGFFGAGADVLGGLGKAFTNLAQPATPTFDVSGFPQVASSSASAGIWIVG